MLKIIEETSKGRRLSSASLKERNNSMKQVTKVAKRWGTCVVSGDSAHMVKKLLRIKE